MILVYHKITNFEWGGTWVTPHQFESQMHYLYQNGYKTINPFHLTGKMPVLPFGGTGFQPVKKKVLITFDDGYENIYTYAYPLLRKYGFNAIIFIIAGYIGKENLWDVNVGFKRFKHLNWEQIKEIQRAGFVFGSHTVTHPDLTKIPINKAKEEIEISKKIIEDKLGKKVDYLSYPFGRYNNLIKKLAKDAGYSASFTLNPFSSERYAIGRMGIYIIDTMEEFRIKVSGKNNVFYKFEGIKGNIINFFSKGTTLWKSTRR